MATCGDCRRKSLLRVGWKREGSSSYCPDCWAKRAASYEKSAAIRREHESLGPALDRYISEETAGAVPVVLSEMARLGKECLPRDPLRSRERFAYVKELVATMAGIRERGSLPDCVALAARCLAAPSVSSRRPEQTAGVLAALLRADPDSLLPWLGDLACEVGAPSGDRRAAVEALRRWQDPRAVEPLTRLLEVQRDDRDGSLIGPALEGLAEVGDERCLEVVLRTLASSRFQGRAASEAARKVSAWLEKSLRPGGASYQLVARYLRAAQGEDQAIEFSTHGKDRVKRALGEAMLSFDTPEAVAVATELSRAEDARVALRGTEVLGRVGSAAAIERLGEIMSNPRKVIVGHFDQGDMWDIPKHEDNWEQRVMAVEGLGRIGGERARSLIRAALQDPNPSVAGAARALLPGE